MLNEIGGYRLYTQLSLAQECGIPRTKLRAALATNAIPGIIVLVTGKTVLLAVPANLRIEVLLPLIKPSAVKGPKLTWRQWVELKLASRSDLGSSRALARTVAGRTPLDY